MRIRLSSYTTSYQLEPGWKPLVYCVWSTDTACGAKVQFGQPRCEDAICKNDVQMKKMKRCHLGSFSWKNPTLRRPREKDSTPCPTSTHTLLRPLSLRWMKTNWSSLGMNLPMSKMIGQPNAEVPVPRPLFRAPTAGWIP